MLLEILNVSHKDFIFVFTPALQNSNFFDEFCWTENHACAPFAPTRPQSMALDKRNSWSGDEGIFLLPSVVRWGNGNDENILKTIHFDSSNFSNDSYLVVICYVCSWTIYPNLWYV